MQREKKDQRNNFQAQREITFINTKDIILRIKEIIITAGGENVAPTNIEEEIKSELPEVRTHADKKCQNKKLKGIVDKMPTVTSAQLFMNIENSI